MKIIETYPGSVDSRIIAEAVEALRAGEIIIYPTDTLYAMGCDALNGKAIEALCRIKGINPDKNLLSIICADLSQAAEYARIDNRAFRMLKHYLPGPFTFILPASTTLPKVFKGRKSVGVRIPACDLPRELARELGNPVLSSSVAAEADESFVELYEKEPGISLAIDYGMEYAEPSTVVDCLDSSAPEVVRQGAGIFEE